MTDKQLALAMLGLVGIAAVILWLSNTGQIPSLGTQLAGQPAQQNVTAGPLSTFPLLPNDTYPVAPIRDSAHGGLSCGCGGFVL